MKWSRVLSVPAAAIAGLAAYDLTQKQHALLRSFPVVGHLRYLLESIGPELRQYIVSSNDEERPFSRDQRTWIYASSKLENNYFGFGTDNDLERDDGYPIIRHRTFSNVVPSAHPHAGEESVIPSAKVLGGSRGRAKAFRPNSVINVSAMSFGSLSGPAIQAINKGAALAGVLHNSGEGGISQHHRQGGDLIWQIGTGYFGCRDSDGRFDLGQLCRVIESAPIRAIEIKLSQGAKPGMGGLLPGAKVSAEIAKIRGIAPGVDCASPSRHAEFDDADSLLDWVEMIAAATGLPVGIKSAVGNLDFWIDLIHQMQTIDRGVDFITIDGGEGGTGAAPLVFADSVGYPFRLGFAQVYRLFAEAGMTDDITFIGSGKLGLPGNAVIAFALGCDMVNVGREIMMAIGCIQTQLCHTDRCPVGVATQDPWLVRGLDPALKSVRAANYIKTLRRDLLKVSEACGVLHPTLIDTEDIAILDGQRSTTSLRDIYGYRAGWGRPSADIQGQISDLMFGTSQGGDAPTSSTPKS